MKRTLGWLAMVLLLLPWLSAQEGQQSEGEQEQRPTLSRAPSSSQRTPQTATVNDYQRLLRMQRIFVERMDNALSEKLVVAVGKLGRFKIVPSPKEADAIMHGSCLESRRLKRVHTEVFISDRGGRSIWQDNIVHPYNPPSLEQAVNDTASVVAQHLGESLEEALRR